MQLVCIESAEHWHKLRLQHCGGSEVAALFGLSPYTTLFELWHHKSGSLPPADLSGDERVQAGLYLEPAVAAWASAKWGIPLRKFVGYVVHSTVKGMGCTPDYMNESGNLLVQLKCVDSLQFRGEWEAEGETIIKAPMHILLQVQHELACTGIAKGWLVVLVGGNRLLRMLIDARPATATKLEKAVTDFWASIAAKAEPSPDFAADGDVIAALHLNADPGKVIDLSASNRAHALCGEWLHGHEMETQGKALKDSAKAEMTILMGEATKATVGTSTVSFPVVKASAGKPVTQDMVGTIIGARAAHRRFSVSTQEEGKQK